MYRLGFSRRIAQPVRDFIVGLFLFGAVAASGLIDMGGPGTGWISSSANAQMYASEHAGSTAQQVLLATTPRLDTAVGSVRQMMVMMSLAIAFATLFSLNLWFARHLKQAHATYRANR